MLFANTGHGPRTDASGPAAAPSGVWLDLLNATEAERAAVAALAGSPLPDRAALAEIEASSRLNTEDGILTLSMPISYRSDEDRSLTTPLGFVLTPERLVTIRFATLPVFDVYAQRFAHAPGPPTSVGAFIGLLEAIVDRQADVLEWVAGELDQISHDVFSTDQRTRKSQDRRLQATLRAIGRKGDALANLRDSLLGVGRIVPYVMDRVHESCAAETRQRFVTLRTDVQSLADYDTQLTNKMQFLLDATLGFINIEQNNGIKVLTVVSVVGVPPTLVASIYGMNFHRMPELDWRYGYFYGLGMIVLSAVMPLLWFRRRGWI